MIRSILCGAIALLAGSALVAAGPQEDVANAAKKLADSSNYSWKTTTEAGGGGQFRGGPTEGKIEKGGLTVLKMTRGDNATEVVFKGDKGAVKTADGWQSLGEASDGGQGNRTRFLARMVQAFKTPAAQAQELAAKVKDLKQVDGVYTGDLTEEGVKSLLTFGGRAGGNGPEISNAKGSAKFWTKDGVLSKIQYHVQGTMSFNGNDREIDRTTTTEISDVGSTKLDIPEEAKKYLP